MRLVISLCAAVALAVGIGQSAAAQTASPSSRPAASRNTSGDHPMSQNPPGAATKPRAPTASTTALKDASAQLQLAMSIHYSGEADKDFAALLAAYQKGATAIANIELQHGTDPDIRQLAEQIKAANEKDAALIQGWQAKHR